MRVSNDGRLYEKNERQAGGYADNVLRFGGGRVRGVGRSFYIEHESKTVILSGILHNLNNKLRIAVGRTRPCVTGARGRGGVPHLRSRTCHAILYSIDNDNEAGGPHRFLQINGITRRPLSCSSPIISARYSSR